MKLRVLLKPAVIVAALGYFVDIYDLLLFNIVRIPSLQSLGLKGQELQMGAYLHNTQMTGMVVGGILWGVLGDKRGRLSVLFGSIILYSAANLLNAFVVNFQQYAMLRFFAGVGLAGELGAGVTLVAETLPKDLRGYGTTIVATVGVLGAVLAGIIGDIFDWRVCYMIGGGLGFLLLLLRIGVHESGMFSELKSKDAVARGNFWMLFSSKPRFFRYLRCILIGVPVWYVIGILVAFAPEFAKVLGATGEVRASKSILFCYAGLSLGDFASGYLSQLLKSRLKPVAIFIGICVLFILIYFNARGFSPEAIYALCFGLGFGTGYWAVLVTIGVEQFGTNLRATAGTTIPNFVRGSLVPVSLSFLFMKSSLGLIGSAAVTGSVVIAVALFSLRGLRETFHQDLDFYET